LKEPVLAKIIQSGGKPHVTFPPQNGQAAINALAPQDYAVIYNINPAYSLWTGRGVTIGVVGRNDLYNGGQDIQNFRNEVGSGINSVGSDNLNILWNGPDPGDQGGGEEAEATLDTTWSGALAPDASIDFVVSGSTNTTDGIDLSEQYIVENNLADIMTESFGTCEYLATDARLQGISALAEQAAAQGITYFVSAGDSGAEGCDDPNVPPATGPISVSALASTPFNVAVGGTMFNENGDPGKYWTSSAPISESAISYIPENVWNESSLTSGLWSGGGGASAGNRGNNLNPPGMTAGVPKPSWQAVAGLNIPQDNVRDLPDVSLTAATHDPYLICFEASCVPNSQNQFYVYFVGGTSASAPSMAGIMALVDQSAGGRQGQANYVFYQLAAAQAAAGIYPGSCNGSNTSGSPASNCVFNDITVGNNVVPGEVGNSYQAGAGYDLTSGLGSVNVSNLINNWSSVTFHATTTTLTLIPTTITHGEAVAVSATVTANSGTPIGDVVLRVSTSAGRSVGTSDLFHLSGGQVSGSSSSLPGSVSGSSTTVWAHYAGDGTYAPSDSAPLQISVSPEASTTSLSLQATDLRGNPVTSPFPFGSLVFVRADVAGRSGHGTATGAVTFTDTCGGPTSCALPPNNPQVNPPVQVLSNPPLDSQGNTSIGDGIISFDAGNHSISASYSGDASFNYSSSSTPVTFTIQPGFAGVSGPTDVAISAPGSSGSTTVRIIASSNFTTPITFTCSGLPGEATCSSASATGLGPTTVVNANITINTTAPHTTTLRSNEQRSYYAVLLGMGLPLAGVFVIGSSRRRRWSTFLGCMMLLTFFLFIPGCGGGSSSSNHQQDPGTPAGTYKVTVTATAGSLIEQGTFTLIVQ
jgi:hypothetical protein